jgi:hypothetical protein
MMKSVLTEPLNFFIQCSLQPDDASADVTGEVWAAG